MSEKDTVGEQQIPDEEYRAGNHDDARPIVGCSPLTGDLYHVHSWEERRDGKFVARDKRALSREDLGSSVSIERVHGVARNAYENGGVQG